MAEDAPSGISYFMLIDKSNQHYLGVLRKWANLKVAFEKEDVWITNFREEQITSATVRSIPYTKTFYCKAGQLYLQNSLLPNRKEPNLLWTPIIRAFPVKAKDYNHNYFGVSEDLEMRLIPEDVPKEAEVLLVSIRELGQFVESAPAVRLKPIRWVLVDTEEALLFGRPLLPVNGQAFWVRKNAIIPIGYNFELSLMTDLLMEKVTHGGDDWVIWNRDASFFKVDKGLLQPLALSSFRKTLQEIRKIEDATVSSGKVPRSI